jgi:dTMP kinase
MFVTFEGPEGSGKSTLIRCLAPRLEGTGRSVLSTKEPGAGTLGGGIRSLLLEGHDVDPKAELFLFLADRSQHVATVLRPALAAGQVVLCDRHKDSTIVYQGYGRGLDLDRLREWNRFATEGLEPDLTILLDLSPERGLERLETGDRRATRDRLDREPLAFHDRVRRGFLEEASREPERWRIVDADREPDQVLEDVWGLLEPRLGAHSAS